MRFYDGMRGACARAGAGTWCRFHASLYHTVTRWFGEPFFADYPFEVCSRSECVREALQKMVKGEDIDDRLNIEEWS